MEITDNNIDKVGYSTVALAAIGTEMIIFGSTVTVVGIGLIVLCTCFIGLYAVGQLEQTKN